MSLEPALFDSTLYETANDAFLFCKAYLEERNPVIAGRLEGLDPINTDLLGRLALRALTEIRGEVRGEAREHVESTMRVLIRALQEKPLQAVA